MLSRPADELQLKTAGLPYKQILGPFDQEHKGTDYVDTKVHLKKPLAIVERKHYVKLSTSGSQAAKINVEDKSDHQAKSVLVDARSRTLEHS